MSPDNAAPLRAILSERPVAWRLATVVAGSWLIAASSWISAPMYPVPMTMQSFAVLLVAGLAGARIASAIVLTWLAQAAIGLPFLADGAGGLSPFEGPTAGYLGGFHVAAWICGWLTEKPVLRGWLAMCGVFLFGHALLLSLGWARLAMLAGPEGAWSTGVEPFLLGSVLKSVLAVVVLKLLEPMLRSLGR